MPENILHTVPHVGYGQDTYTRCWYASYRMIFKSMNRSENEIKDKLVSKINFDDAYDHGLLISDYEKCANALDLEILDTAPFRKEQTFFDIGLSDGAEAFLVHLRKKPLWVSRYSSKGVYHITVAVGYDDKSSSIIFHNPFPGPTDARENLTLGANTYVKFITQQLGSVQMPK